jgi:metal-sulfur cluster biosynthetic enzyme
MPSKPQDPRRQAVWEIQSTHPELSEQVEEALREVLDPELGLNIIELGLVRDVSYSPDDEKAHVKMIMTTPFCPYAPALLEMTREKTGETLGVEATIEMGMEPWDFSYMEEGLGADWGLF